MKKVFVIAAIFFIGMFTAPVGNAQVNVNVNIGRQPAWGPTGYDYAPFYYFPDFNFYFDVARNQYIVLNNNMWVYMNSIPGRFGFDPYNAYKVVINQNRPYLYNRTHIRNYAKYKGQGNKQPMIRDSREEKYFQSKQHPQHNEWVKQHPNQNNNGGNNSNGGNRVNNSNGGNNQQHPNNAGNSNNGRGGRPNQNGEKKTDDNPRHSDNHKNNGDHQGQKANQNGGSRDNGR